MIYLNSKEIIFIIKTLDLTPDLKVILENIHNGGEISDDTSDILRDFCTDKIDEVGYDENYEVTKIGEVLDILIDKLYTG